MKAKTVDSKELIRLQEDAYDAGVLMERDAQEPLIKQICELTDTLSAVMYLARIKAPHAMIEQTAKLAFKGLL